MSVEPWGITVTGTCHLHTPGVDLGPACGNLAVRATIEGLRRRYRSGDRDAPPIFGPAGRRPVCRNCIRSLEMLAERSIERVAVGRAWNRERGT